jgi:hypothetical protein
MPLALNRTGVVFKKCDMAGHKPDSNKACAAGTCQHTCTDIERCPHAWTLRYWADGKQRERSFKDEDRHGRSVYGSGRKLAQDAQLKLTVDKRRRQDVRRLHHGGQGELRSGGRSVHCPFAGQRPVAGQLR